MIFCLIQALLYLHTEASSAHSNNIIPNIDEVEMTEIKTEPIESDGEISNIVDTDSIECINESKIHLSYFSYVLNLCFLPTFE